MEDRKPLASWVPVWCGDPICFRCVFYKFSPEAFEDLPDEMDPYSGPNPGDCKWAPTEPVPAWLKLSDCYDRDELFDECPAFKEKPDA